MTAATLTLTAFLEQRIAEDEAVARAAISADSPSWKVSGGRVEAAAADFAVHDVFDYTITFDEGSPSPAQQEHIARHDPARVLAECAAKGAIVEMITEDCYPESLLRALASVYASHPDFDEAWAL